jgi:predicted ABC-type transport system involved in lysophospholipase L1 biosynthesis ATPase subunit
MVMVTHDSVVAQHAQRRALLRDGLLSAAQQV